VLPIEDLFEFLNADLELHGSGLSSEDQRLIATDYSKRGYMLT